MSDVAQFDDTIEMIQLLALFRLRVERRFPIDGGEDLVRRRNRSGKGLDVRRDIAEGEKAPIMIDSKMVKT